MKLGLGLRLLCLGSTRCLSILLSLLLSLILITLKLLLTLITLKLLFLRKHHLSNDHLFTIPILLVGDGGPSYCGKSEEDLLVVRVLNSANIGVKYAHIARVLNLPL